MSDSARTRITTALLLMPAALWFLFLLVLPLLVVLVFSFGERAPAGGYQAAFTLLDEIPASGKAPFAILFDQGPLQFSTYQIVPLSAVPARADGRTSRT